MESVVYAHVKKCMYACVSGMANREGRREEARGKRLKGREPMDLMGLMGYWNKR